jgi:putative spermidine/putrescine transport system ATP-binding protein
MQPISSAVQEVALSKAVPASTSAVAAPAVAVRSPGVGVELRGLRRSYGDVHALEGMSLNMAPGEMVVLLGPSGCGKTTALRVLAGLEDADAGQVIVDGKDISSVPTSKRDMGMVFQAYSLFPHMTARDNVSFGLRLRGKGAGERKKIAEHYLELVGLDNHADRYAHQMSGGQQQRVALARALAIQPKVLLLDEPLSALDAKVRVQLRDEIRRIQLEVGTTTLFVTHDQEEALAVADRVGVMRAGRIEQIDKPDVIYSAPTTAFVAGFIGLTNKMVGNASGGAVSVLGSTVPLLPGSPTSGEVTALVRPEAIRFTPSVTGNGLGTATVVATSFLGAHGRVQARVADGTILLAQMSVGETVALQPGQVVDVAIAPSPVLATA